MASSRQLGPAASRAACVAVHQRVMNAQSGSIRKHLAVSCCALALPPVAGRRLGRHAHSKNRSDDLTRALRIGGGGFIGP